MRRIPALCGSSARLEAKAPEYGALQTLRALVWQSGFLLQRYSKNLPENGVRWGQVRPIRYRWPMTSTRLIALPGINLEITLAVLNPK